MTTQVEGNESFITASVRSQITSQLAAKMTCGLKSPTFADSEVRTVRMPQI